MIPFWKPKTTARSTPGGERTSGVSSNLTVGVSHGAGNVKDDTPYVIEIRHNFFQDDHEWGIDLDDGSSNTHVYNNLCVGMSVKLREGDYRLVENNIFIHPANPPGFHVGYEYNHDRFIRNIIVTSTKFDRPALDINFKRVRPRQIPTR